MTDKVDSGDYTPADKYRRQIALALLGQGFGKHGRAGGIGVAADAVNGLVGGYMLRGADLDEKEANATVAAALAKQPGWSSGTTAPVVPPSTPSASATPGAAAITDGVVTPEHLRTVRRLESGGDDRARTGSYVGRYQFGPQEWAKYGGGGDIYSGDAQDAAATRKFADDAAAFQKQFGRQPTGSELYLWHQQGAGGLGVHLANPDRPAWENMASTGEGRQKGAGWARQAIWGNIPYDVRKQFGSVDNVTSKQFMDMWAGKYGRIAGPGGAPPPIQTAQAGNTITDIAPQPGGVVEGMMLGPQPAGPPVGSPERPMSRPYTTGGQGPVVRTPVMAQPPAGFGASPAGAQTAQALPTPQPTPQQPPASQPGAQAGPSADQVAYYQKLVAEAQRTGNPKITQMAMQYRAQVEAQLQKAGTDDIKEYEYGRRNPGYAEYELAKKRAGATSITNAPDFRGEVAESKARGEVVGKAAGEREVAYENVDAKAHTKLGTIAIMRQGMKDPNFFSGGGVIGDTLAPAWKRMQVLMGGDPNAAASVETFGALSKQMALEKMGGSLGTGFSNADRDFVVGQVPGLANTPAGNAALLDVTERIEKRNIEVGRMYRAWKKENKGAAINDFKEYMMDWEERNPVFPPDDPIFKAAGEEAAAPKGAGKFSNPAMKPGEWTDVGGVKIRKK